MRGRTVYAEVKHEGEIIQTEPRYQLDYGILLSLSGEGLPDSYRVDFCNAGDTQTLPATVPENGFVAIPDSLFSDGRDIQAYVRTLDERSSETRAKIVIPIIRRPAIETP